MASSVFLAVDMGASSGRHVAGVFDGQRLDMQEVYRFENGPVAAAGRLYWDVLEQWQQVCHGLRAAKRFGASLRSVGVDTWGVDFALLGRHDELLGNPRHYRDPHTGGMLERAFQTVSRDQIFAQTGLQFMQINSLYQLLAMRLSRSPLLDAAESLLMMPDVFHWLLTGVKANEFTDATTTQFFDPARHAWATSLFDAFELPSKILGPIVEPGTRLGPLTKAVADLTGQSNLQVVLPGTHDTASAVLAVPAAGDPSPQPDWCYISSGTWSLMGAELTQPIINNKCQELNFTNEGGIAGTIRVLKNISGLWLLQECRRVWNAAGQNLSFDDLDRLSAAAPLLASLVDPDDPSFLAPGDMPAAIQQFCRRTGQTVPADEGAVVRCAIESLALKYRQVLGWLELLVGRRIETIHIVGGGSKNRLLSQAAADACGRRVLAGPVEATAIGNVLMQAISAGELSSVQQAREIVRRSFGVDEYQPRDTAMWNAAYERFSGIVERASKQG